MGGRLLGLSHSNCIFRMFAMWVKKWQRGNDFFTPLLVCVVNGPSAENAHHLSISLTLALYVSYCRVSSYSSAGHPHSLHLPLPHPLHNKHNCPFFCVQRICDRFLCVFASLSHVSLSVNPWTAALQAPLSMGFSSQEYWSGLPCLSPIGLYNLYQIYCFVC